MRCNATQGKCLDFSKFCPHGQMIFGDLVGLTLPDIRLTGEEKTRKNLTQETCPDRESNPGPLRGKRACYRLLASRSRKGGLSCRHWLSSFFETQVCKISPTFVQNFIKIGIRATPGTPASIIFNFKISKTTASMFTTTCESFIAIEWTVCGSYTGQTNKHYI